ncbi:MAG TPA: hypothetical protein VGB50_00605 [Flavobacterium sp.]
MKKLYYILFLVVGSTIGTLAQESQLIASTAPTGIQKKMDAATLTERPNVQSGNSQDVAATNAEADKAKTKAREMKNLFESIPKTIMPPPPNNPPFSGTR